MVLKKRLDKPKKSKDRNGRSTLLTLKNANYCSDYAESKDESHDKNISITNYCSDFILLIILAIHSPMQLDAYAQLAAK